MNKKYEDLTFTDDFMFCHILVEHTDLCIELTEMITGRKVREIVTMHTQKAVQITEDGKGVRFSRGLHKYTFKEICEECPDLQLEDGTEKIFICAGGKEEDCTDKMKKFLDYISKKLAADDFTRRLQNALISARQKDKWRSSYMTWINMQNELREEGRKEGRAEGIQKNAYEVYNRLLQKGFDKAEALAISGYIQNPVKVPD